MIYGCQVKRKEKNKAMIPFLWAVHNNRHFISLFLRNNTWHYFQWACLVALLYRTWKSVVLTAFLLSPWPAGTLTFICALNMEEVCHAAKVSGYVNSREARHSESQGKRENELRLGSASGCSGSWCASPLSALCQSFIIPPAKVLTCFTRFECLAFFSKTVWCLVGFNTTACWQTVSL